MWGREREDGGGAREVLSRGPSTPSLPLQPHFPDNLCPPAPRACTASRLFSVGGGLAQGPSNPRFVEPLMSLDRRHFCGSRGPRSPHRRGGG